MTADLIARLKEAAGKATPGEWRYGRLGTKTLEHVVDFGPQPKPPFVAVPPHGVCHGADESGPANAAYILAAQPANILALISENDRLREALTYIGDLDSRRAGLEDAQRIAARGLALAKEAGK